MNLAFNTLIFRWSGGWDSNPLTQRERIYSPPRLSNFAAPRYKNLRLSNCTTTHITKKGKKCPSNLDWFVCQCRLPHQLVRYWWSWRQESNLQPADLLVNALVTSSSNYFQSFRKFIIFCKANTSFLSIFRWSKSQSFSY